MVTKKISFTTSSKLDKTTKVEPGDLILLGRNIRTINLVFGVFSNFVNGKYICFAEQPYRLKTFLLPSGINYASFVPLPVKTDYKGQPETSHGKRIIRVEKWEHYTSSRNIEEIVSGKENILERLRSDPEHRYDTHAESIERMQKPYVNDLEIRKRLEIA